MSLSNLVSGLLKRVHQSADEGGHSPVAKRVKHALSVATSAQLPQLNSTPIAVDPISSDSITSRSPRVIHTFQKTAKRGAMRGVPQLDLTCAEGVVGDWNCKLVGPRQVLVSRLEDLVNLGLAPGQLRENIVVAGLERSMLRSGLQVRFGRPGAEPGHAYEGPALRLTIDCEPCGHVLDQLPSDKKALKLTVPKLLGKRGVLATVLRDGVVKAGDSVQVSDALVYERIPASMREQVAWLLVSKMPRGKIVTYKDILRLIGQPAGCARALPIVLKKLRDSHEEACPVHRVVDTSGRLILKHVPDQAEKLRAEGVRERDGQVLDLKSVLWNPLQQELYHVLNTTC